MQQSSKVRHHTLRVSKTSFRSMLASSVSSLGSKAGGLSICAALRLGGAALDIVGLPSKSLLTSTVRPKTWHQGLLTGLSYLSASFNVPR